MIFFTKRYSHFAHTKIGRLATVSLITSLSFAMVNTIWAIYMDSFFHNIVLVGFFAALLATISFLSYFLIIPLIEKTSKSKIFIWSLILFAITYVLFAINTKLYIFVILAFIIVFLRTLKVTSLGIIIRDSSSKKQLSQNEGLVYTFANISWLIGPLIAGFIAEKYNFGLIFILGAIFTIIAVILFKFSKIQDNNKKKIIDKNILKNFIDFFKSKNRTLAYILGGGVNLWWSLIYVFIPLFIIRNNLGEMWVGFFLAGVIIPLILLEYPFSKLAGKIGFKKLFKIGYLIPCLLALSCFFITNVFIILTLLILASIGKAMTEPTTEAYFFDILKEKEALRFYPPYNTAIGVGMFIGQISAATLLIFLPFKYIFILFSIFMFIMFIISFTIKDVVEKKR